MIDWGILVLNIIFAVTSAGMWFVSGTLYGRRKGYLEAMDNMFKENDRIIDKCVVINKELIEDFDQQMQLSTKVYRDHIHDLTMKLKNCREIESSIVLNTAGSDAPIKINP